MRTVYSEFCALRLCAIFAVLLTNLPSLECTIQCYKCSMTAPSVYSNETKRLCSDFDYSDHFIVDCPYSTLCMKKDFTVNFPVPINGTLRDCAKQKYETQNYKNGKWRPEIHIEEAYEEGCSQLDDKGQRSSTTQYCYCRGDLCNSSSIFSISIVTYFVMLSVIYCNSARLFST